MIMMKKSECKNRLSYPINIGLLVCQFLMASLLVSCATSAVQVTGRSTGLFEKNGAHVGSSARAPGHPSERPEMYIRQKNVNIDTVGKENSSGSLFNPTDERNFLFTSSGPVSVGRYVDIKVVSKRVEKEKDADKQEKNEPEKADDDKITAELLKALPDFAPAEPGENSALKRFSMKIAHRYENGDALVTMQRTSLVNGEANEISLAARVPYDRLISGYQLTTDDLNDVKYVESYEGEVSNRFSSGWEDEYTMRMSGFNEAKSRVASDLEQKRQRLEEAKDRVKNQIVSMSKERQKVADERDRVFKQSTNDRERMADLEGTIEQQKSKINEQAEIIQEMSPEEKSGDSKDGSDGA